MAMMVSPGFRLSAAMPQEQGPQVPPDFQLGGGSPPAASPTDPTIQAPPLMGGGGPGEFRFDKAGEAVKGVAAYGNGIAERAKAQQQLGELKLNFSPTDGTFKAEGPSDLLMGVLKKAQTLDAYQQNYDRMLAENEQRMANIRANPWQNTLAHIAASFGANDPNPYTRSMAQAATRLNPTLDQLRSERMEILQPAQQNVAQQTRLMETAMAHEQNMALRREAMADRKERTHRQLVEDTERKINTYVSPFASIIKEKAGAMPDKEKFLADFVQQTGASRSRGESEYRQLELEQKSAAVGRKTLTDEAVDRTRRETKVREEEKKKDDDSTVEAIANGILGGDLVSMRELTSLRGDLRGRVYARLKQKDPNFSQGKLNRKIKMQESWDVGKDRDDLRRFGTFLQHGGELADTLEGVKRGDVRAYNAGLNWWATNMQGTPELARLVTAIEPVAKEYMSFLLGGRALYQSDREAMTALLNSNYSPKYLHAVLNQMGKTAKDRYKEMEHQYVRLMDKLPDDPFSDEAIRGAKKMGIDLLDPGAASSHGQSRQGGPSWDGYQEWLRKQEKQQSARSH